MPKFKPETFAQFMALSLTMGDDAKARAEQQLTQATSINMVVKSSNQLIDHGRDDVNKAIAQSAELRKTNHAEGSPMYKHFLAFNDALLKHQTDIGETIAKMGKM